ncbi:MAG TPA: prefoldin subunit alpha [Candidatus Dormibacteraeota bacterium]|nr:prefoldin subunit alpha [Candidatus Dormibacteraeota bacterium]
MSSTQVKEEDVVRQLAAEIRVLEGSIALLQSRLDIVRAAINELTLAHNTLEGVKKLQNGESTLVPVGAGSYVRMRLEDTKKLIMGIGAGVAVEKDVESSVTELKERLQELDKARTSLQQQLDQTGTRYQQDREALEDILRRQNASTRTK